MPVYEFHCPGCGRRFETLIRSGQEPECPDCGARNLERLLSIPAPPAGANRMPDVSGLGPPGGCSGGCSCH